MGRGKVYSKSIKIHDSHSSSPKRGSKAKKQRKPKD
jgi:hypothetical protein